MHGLLFSIFTLAFNYYFLVLNNEKNARWWTRRDIFFAKSKAKIISADKPKVLFSDVAGCEEAKVELQEIVGFLKIQKNI